MRKGDEMKRVLLCCGGGFSSSALVNKVKKEIIDEELETEYYIEFSPFSLAYEKMDNFDIVVCCPHLKFEVDKLLKEKEIKVPFYILPPVMYGMMKFKELYLDIEDAIELFKNTNLNPVKFAGEENIHRVQRGVAYRNYKGYNN